VVGLALGALAVSCTAGPAAPSDGKRAASTPRPQSSGVALRSLQLVALPPVDQPGTSAQPATDARPVLVASARPTRAGASVTLQQQTDSGWRSLGTSSTDATGTVSFEPPPPDTGGADARYRVVSAASPSVRSPTTSDEPWKVGFSDEFDGTSLGSPWAYRQLGELSAASGRTVSASSERAVRVGDGILQLQVMKDPSVKGHYLNAHVATDPSYMFRYGVAAARIKFQRPRGTHGAFWSQSPTFGDLPGDPGASGTEIDVGEYFGDGYPNGGLASYVYHVDAKGSNIKDGSVLPRAARAVGSADAFWKKYHVFSVDWSPHGYVFRIDGTVTYRTDKAVSRRSQYLILSLLSSDWELPDLDQGLLPATMDVDWVRVWQRH
jgi:beta-glucanase (GH16 family)